MRSHPFPPRFVRYAHAPAYLGMSREVFDRDVRIHDLRHTYAGRLRLAGVSQEDRNALMGHQGRSIPELYAAADVGRLIEMANRVLNRAGTRTLLRVVNG